MQEMSEQICSPINIVVGADLRRRSFETENGVTYTLNRGDDVIIDVFHGDGNAVE